MKEIGKIGFTPRGPYSEKIYYEPLDVVTFEGSSYVALEHSMSIPLDNGYYWLMIAQGGVIKWDKIPEEEKDKIIKKIEEVCAPYEKRIKNLEEEVANIPEDIDVKLYTDSGTVIRNGEGEIVIYAEVWKGDKNITEEISSFRFTWLRTSDDPKDDEIWNMFHTADFGQKSIKVTKEDVKRRALFECVVKII